MPEKKKFLLRIDPDLYSALERWANDEFRSVNAQIEFVLRQAAKSAGKLKKDAPETPEEDDP